MFWPTRSTFFFIIFATLKAIYAIHAAHRTQQRHTLDAPASVTEAPVAVVDPLNLLLGYGPELNRRAQSEDSALRVTIAPDETCGFIDGKKDLPVTCANSRACSWAASSGLGLIACASDIYVACIDSSQAVNSAECNDECRSNTFNLLCTDSDHPYCRTYAYPGSIFDYSCASTTVDDYERVYFTSEGKKRADLITTTLSSDSSGTSEGLQEVVTVTVQEKSSRSQAAVTIIVIPQLPSAAATSSHSPTTDNKSTPVGPIVGGVVGGVAVLGLIGLGAFYLVRRRTKNKPQKDMTASGQPNMSHSMDQNQHPYHPQHQGAVPHYTDVSMVSSPPLDARMSMMTGSVSPNGQSVHGGGGKLPPTVQNPAPAYEMAGSEAREAEPVYEMVGDSSKGK